MPKPEKIETINSVKKYLQDAKSIFVTDYTGLNVADMTVLRKRLRENSVKYLITKNTLLKIAAKETGYEGIADYLTGPTAIAFGFDDPAVPAKILYSSFKEKEKPIIKAFVLDKELHKGSEILRLAELPSREILLATLIGTIESPMTSLVCSLDAIMQGLVGTVDALAKARG